MDEGGLNYWVSVLNENVKDNDSRQAMVLTVNKIMEAEEMKEIARDIGIVY